MSDAHKIKITKKDMQSYMKKLKKKLIKEKKEKEQAIEQDKKNSKCTWIFEDAQFCGGGWMKTSCGEYFSMDDSSQICPHCKRVIRRE